ncbi:MAG: hypothetical protein C4K58_06450 [Flavobacteriaceae bacterium]|nr:MAG: hypothetical protein C4K58_06450 [Flavobacteriaceae bacterium]
MKHKLSILCLFFLVFMANGQKRKNTNNSEASQKSRDKQVEKGLYSDHILEKITKEICLCTDSISLINKSSKEAALEISDCIDKFVSPYLTLNHKSVGMAKGDQALTVIVNPESQEYQKAYRVLESELMENCPSVKQTVASENTESENSVSKNLEAIKQYDKGIVFLKKEDYKNALPFFQKAVEIDPNFAFAWDNLGLCHRKLMDLDAAIFAYNKSLELDPNGKMPLQNLPIVYVYKKEYQKAIDMFERLGELDPNNPEVYYGIGVIYFENLKDYEKALDYMSKAYNLYTVQKSPYRVDAQRVMQQIYLDFKQKGKLELFDQILKQNNISLQ